MLDFNWTQQTFVGQLSKSLESINLSVGEPFQHEFGAPTRDVDWVFDVWGPGGDLNLSRNCPAGTNSSIETQMQVPGISPGL